VPQAKLIDISSIKIPPGKLTTATDSKTGETCVPGLPGRRRRRVIRVAPTDRGVDPPALYSRNCSCVGSVAGDEGAKASGGRPGAGSGGRRRLPC
jgi:hypothetical protein